MTRKLTMIAVGLGTVGMVQAQQSQLSIYNLIVRNNVNQANHVYGRAIVQNISLYSGSNMEIGAQSYSGNSYGLPVVNSGTYSLQVGGSVSIPSGNYVRLVRGSAFLDENSTTAPGGRIDVQQSGAGIVRAGTAGSTQSQFDSVFNAIANESSTYAARTANGTVTTSGNTATFNLPSSTSARQVTFNLTEAQAQNIFSSSSIGSVAFNLNGRSLSSIDSIIVNIAGFNTQDFFANQANLTFNGDAGTVAFRQRLLWNFYQADEDIFIDRNWYGSILAPNAFLQGSANIDGSVAVNNICFNAEIHGPTWTGVPEPSTYAAVTFVVGLAGWSYWRRRQAPKTADAVEVKA